MGPRCCVVVAQVVSAYRPTVCSFVITTMVRLISHKSFVIRDSKTFTYFHRQIAVVAKWCNTRTGGSYGLLQLYAARRDAITNSKSFRPQDTSDLISIVSFIFALRRHLMQLAP